MLSLPYFLFHALAQRQPSSTASPSPASAQWGPYRRQIRLNHNWRIRLTLIRVLLGLIFVTIGTLALGILVGWLLIPGVRYRDFTGIYLLASAIRYGMDITLPLTTIGERLGIAPNLVGFYHPTPHPPTMGLLFLPFGYIDYAVGSLMWLAIEFLLLVAAIVLLARLIGFRFHLLLGTLIALALVGCWPVFEELKWGQVGMLLLLLHVGMLLLLQRGHPGRAGVLLGLALLLKPLTVPVPVLLLLRRQWRALGATIGTVVGGYIVALLVVGPTALIKYFTQSLPSVGRFYSTFWPNISLATLGSRLFESMWLPAILPRPEEKVMASDPLVVSPFAAHLITVLVPVLVIGVGLWVVRRLPLDLAIPILLCISIAVSPISWTHYELLALPLIAQTLAWLHAHHWPRKPTLAVVCILLPMVFPLIVWVHLGLLFTRPRLEGELPYYPAVATLPMLIPAILLLLLGALGIWIARHPYPPALDTQT